MNIAVHPVEPSGSAASLESVGVAVGMGNASGTADFEQTLAATAQTGELKIPDAGRDASSDAKLGNARTEKKPASTGEGDQTQDAAGGGTPGLDSTLAAASAEIAPVLVLPPIPLPLLPTAAAQSVAAGAHVSSRDGAPGLATQAQQGMDGSVPHATAIVPGGDAAAEAVLAKTASPVLPVQLSQVSRSNAGEAAAGKPEIHESAHGAAAGVSVGRATATAAAPVSASALSSLPTIHGPAAEKADTPAVPAVSADAGQREGSVVKPLTMNGAAATSTTFVIPQSPVSSRAISATAAVPDAGVQSSVQGTTSNAGGNAQTQSGSGGAKQAASDTQVSPVLTATGVAPFAAAVAGTMAGPVGGMKAMDEQAAPAADRQVSASGVPSDLAAGQTAQAGGINTARVLATMNGTEMRVGMHSADFGSVSIAATVSPAGVSAQIALEHGGLGQALSTHLSAIEEKLGVSLGVNARVEMRETGSAAAQGNSEHAPGGNSTGSDGSTASGGNASGGRARAQTPGDWSYTTAIEPVAGRAMAADEGRLSVQA